MKKWELDSSTVLKWGIPAAALLLISAVFLPPALVVFFQEILYFSEHHWAFIPYPSAFQLMAAAMAWAALCIISLFVTMLIAEGKKRTYRGTAVHAGLGLLSLPLLALSLGHYAYIDDEGVHTNAMWSFSEETMAWEDVQHVERLTSGESVTVNEYAFADENRTFIIPYNANDFPTTRAMTQMEEEHGLEAESPS